MLVGEAVSMVPFELLRPINGGYLAGVACLVGMITNVGAFIGGDAPAHMAEELKSASKLLPRAMLWTILVNGAMGFIMLM